MDTPLLKRSEARKYLGVSDALLMRYVRNGELVATDMSGNHVERGKGSRLRFHIDDIKAFLKSRRLLQSAARQAKPPTRKLLVNRY